MAKTANPLALGPLARGLRVVSERRTTSDLLTRLQHPLAAESAQRALLDVLGHRTRRTFRNTWHFLNWAQSNGVDLLPPARTAVRGRPLLQGPAAGAEGGRARRLATALG
jgi:hypothetical protein